MSYLLGFNKIFIIFTEHVPLEYHNTDCFFVFVFFFFIINSHVDEALARDSHYDVCLSVL